MCSVPIRPPSPPTPPPRRTTAPHIFFTNPMRAASGPATKRSIVANATVTPSEATATSVAPSTSTPAQAVLASAATADLTSADPEIASTSSTACFLGLATELRCQIYNYLWTPEVDVFIKSPDLLPSSAIHPVFHVNRQIREEAVDSLNKDYTVTLQLHAVVDDLDFRKMVTVLRKLGNKYFKRGGEKQLHAYITLKEGNIDGAALEPESFGKFIACLEKFDLKVDYEAIPRGTDAYSGGNSSSAWGLVSRRLITDGNDRLGSESQLARKAIRELFFLW